MTNKQRNRAQNKYRRIAKRPETSINSQKDSPIINRKQTFSLLTSLCLLLNASRKILSKFRTWLLITRFFHLVFLYSILSQKRFFCIPMTTKFSFHLNILNWIFVVYYFSKSIYENHLKCHQYGVHINFTS